MIDILTIYAVVAILFFVFLLKFIRNFKFLKKEEKAGLLGLVISFALFTSLSFISDFSKDYQISVLGTRLVTLVPTWFAYSIYLISKVYPISIKKYENRKIDRLLLIINIVLSFILLIFIQTPFIIESFELTNTTPNFTYGSLYYLAAALSMVNVGFAIFIWVKNLKLCIRHQRKQIRYTVLSVFISTFVMAIAFLVFPEIGLSKYSGFSFIGLFWLIYYFMNSILVPDELVDLSTAFKDFGFILLISGIVLILLLSKLEVKPDNIILSFFLIFCFIFLVIRIDEKIKVSRKTSPLDNLSSILTNIVDQKEVFNEVKVRLNSYFKPENIKIVQKTELPSEILKLFLNSDVVTYEGIFRLYPQMSRELFSYMNTNPSFLLEAWDYAIVIFNSTETLTHDISDKLRIFASDLNIALQRSVYRYSYAELSKEFDTKVENKTKDLQLVNNKLIESDRKKSEFLSIASHQLRTPIATLVGYTESLKLGDFGNYPENLKPVISSINDSAMYLSELVNDFLNVTKVEEGKLIIARSKINVLDLIEECYLEAKDRVEKKGIRFLKKFDIPESLTLNLDALKTKQCIMNLLDNAIKYTEKGYIRYESFIQDDNWVFVVSDTGMGISPEYKKRMFEKFSRAPEAIKLVPDGSGIGLYLVRSIVDLQGGSMSVESEIGKGSTFIVKFHLT